VTASTKKKRVARELKPINLGERLALTPREFGAALGKSGTLGYRALYRGWIKAISDCGRLMIPISEVHRFLDRAAQYNPQSKKRSADENGREG
jgi:hypothetical protein